MNPISLSVHPKDATAKILKCVSNKRAEDVLTRRFGIRGKKATLEAIGKQYGITRERVRQIEEAAMKSLADNDSVKAELVSFAPQLKDHLLNHGGVSEEKRYFNSVVDEKFHPHLNFLLLLARPVFHKEEDEKHYTRWHAGDESLSKAETVVHRVTNELEEKKKVVSESDLWNMFEKHARETFGTAKDERSVESYMSIAKPIAKNPYGEYGLVHWPEINPVGVRDKAYVVLTKLGKPLHFTEVAKQINKVGWSRKRSAHPQTVHNELIKDNRFVLVGRGMYALKEWGYEPGTVKDVLVSVMKSAGKPLSKDEIIKRIGEKRIVKANTVFLNLQDKRKFKKMDTGYTLV